MTTDASNRGIGFTLFQEVDSNLAPILYEGRVLSKAERNYSTTDEELLACYFAVKKCEFYILGNEFVVYSDHQPFSALKIISRYCKQAISLDCAPGKHER